MYYATKRSNNSTRVAGLVAVLVINAVVFWAMASGFGASMMAKITETQVQIVEQPKDEEPPPPPPPPVDVDLPPPPPTVVLPDFQFTPTPSPAAIQEVKAAPAAPRPEVKPAPPAAITVAVKPKPGRRFEKPDYPPASIRAQEHGEVSVSVCVDTEGRMTNVQLVKSSGFPRLDDATVKGLPRTRLDPAKGSDGKPIAVCNPPYVFTLEWRLEDAK